MNPYDVAVIGGGPAGLSAALVLARARRAVVVVDAGAPRNAPAAHLQGFLSRDGTPPTELLTVGRAEVTAYGGHLLSGTVTSVRALGDPGFEVRLDDERHLVARRVLVTTGLVDEVPDIPGLRERWGRDVLHCPYCHGYEVRDRRLGVVGDGPQAVQHALLIRQWSSDVVYVDHTGTLTAREREQLAASDVVVVDGLVARVVVDDDELLGLELADGRIVGRDAVFVRPTFRPRAELLTTLGCTTHDDGSVVADATGRTSVAGVWVAGNAVNPRAQVITAAGEGSAAAIALNNDLVAEDVQRAVDDRRATHLARNEKTPLTSRRTT